MVHLNVFMMWSVVLRAGPSGLGGLFSPLRGRGIYDNCQRFFYHVRPETAPQSPQARRMCVFVGSLLWSDDQPDGRLVRFAVLDEAFAIKCLVFQAGDGTAQALLECLSALHRERRHSRA